MGIRLREATRMVEGMEKSPTRMEVSLTNALASFVVAYIRLESVQNERP